MEIGIVGLPYAGKRTIFSTLLKHKSMDQAGARQAAERGVVKVPDERLNKLTTMFNPKKQVNTTIEYVKVAGLEEDGGQSQGLTSKFLNNLKNVDALMVIIRDFENEFYPHPMNRVDPPADIEYINGEFLISDLMVVEKRVEKLDKMVMKTQNEQDKRELAVMHRLKEQLDMEKPLRELDFSENESDILKTYQFITLKPIVYVINIAENKIAESAQIEAELSRFKTPQCSIITLSAEIEKEISELSEEDSTIFMEDLGIKEPALSKLIRASYELLGLISFFTVGDDECRSWTIRKGNNAQKAAGVIHSDLEKGFIRAETASYDDLMTNGSLAACKDKGVLRLEGKEYLVKDGDILNIRFNV